MSLREPQREALAVLDQISNKVKFGECNKTDAESAASEVSEGVFNKTDDAFDFPSFCFEMATGIGKTRLMGAAIFYLNRTRGFRHFFILAPGSTIYDKLRKESLPNHPKYMFKGLEEVMGRPKVYDGENYLKYPVHQHEWSTEDQSEIQLFIFNIGKIFNRGDVQFKFHDFHELLGGSFAEVLKSFDDLVICMDEAHRYYAPASLKAINYLNPVLGLEFTATPKSTNKNIIFKYDLAKGAGKYLKIPVVMGRTNTAGYTDADIEQMKIMDGLKLHELRKNVVYRYCYENELDQMKPIVLIACRDTAHAASIRDLIDSDEVFEGKYRGKVIEIHSGSSSVESDENIMKLLTIESSGNPIEIVIHVYKLKEGWDVNNLFTIIPLNAAKSEILALQTIGRGLRLPFGKITGNEELDTLDIVAHDHYREIVDEIHDNPIFKTRDLDERGLPDIKSIDINPEFDDQQIAIFESAVEETAFKSFQDISDMKVQEELYRNYLKAYAKAEKPVSSLDYEQMSLFDLEDQLTVNGDENLAGIVTDTTDTPSSNKTKPVALKKEEFIEKITRMQTKAINVPRISMSYSSTIEFVDTSVKRNIQDFEIARSLIQRFDVVNAELLQSVEASVLDVSDPENELACMLLESIPEFSADDADFILNVVNQYLDLIEGTNADKKKIVRRYAVAIVEDLKKQIYDAMNVKTEFVYQIEKKLIVFKKFSKGVKSDGFVNFKKDISDKRNIRQYLFEGFSKSYYPAYGFDSDDERRMAVILEEDKDVIRWIKPPLNQMGLFYRAAKQYTPDFLVEYSDGKYMVEVKAESDLEDDDVLDKARAAIKWCKCATGVDPDNKPWEYRLISGSKIATGNTFRYTVGIAENLEGLTDE
ncbi:MAG: DEAD/DEAH box helicase family protein [Bacillota bacterium]|nr:DEAD/DEAH box helicase family protein [Bacillota bacterium]